MKDELKDYLNVITLYINDRCNRCCPMCKSAYKQFLFCFKRDAAKNEMDIDDIAKLVKELKNSKLYKLNIVGGNIFCHSKFSEIINTLNQARLIKNYCIHYLNIEDKPGYFDLLRDGDNRLTIFAHFPLEMDIFSRSTALLNRYDIKKRFQLVIEKDEDIVKAEEIISAFQQEDFELTPYYNGSNPEFFKENVFLDKDAIIQAKPAMSDIFARMTINTSNFKELTVLSTKKVYANLNNHGIGRLGKDHIFDLIYREMHKGRSWTKVRKHVAPCKSCVFNALCPPISNYETAVGRYNLCDIL